MYKNFIMIVVFHIYKPNLEFGETVEVSVDVHHLDSFHGHHGDLRGDCQPVCDIIFKSLSTFNFKC